MTDKLLPCLLCGGDNTTIDERYMPPVVNRPPSLISANVMHWCERPEGIVAATIKITGRTRDAAVDCWNDRMRPRPPSME